MRFTLVGLAVAAGLTIGAQASLADGLITPSSNPWTGLFVSTSVGYGWSDSSQKLSFDGFPIASTSFSADGAIGAAGVGYDWALSNNFVLGVFGDYTFGGIDDTYSLDGQPLTGRYDNIWSAGARAGYIVLPNTMLFATGGYTNADFEAGSDVGSESKNLDGFFVGGGIERQLSDNLFFKAEYRYSNFGTWTEACDCEFGTIRSDVDSEVHSIRFGIALKFGTREEAVAPLK